MSDSMAAAWRQRLRNSAKCPPHTCNAGRWAQRTLAPPHRRRRRAGATGEPARQCLPGLGMLSGGTCNAEQPAAAQRARLLHTAYRCAPSCEPSCSAPLVFAATGRSRRPRPPPPPSAARAPSCAATASMQRRSAEPCCGNSADQHLDAGALAAAYRQHSSQPCPSISHLRSGSGPPLPSLRMTLGNLYSPPFY